VAIVVRPLPRPFTRLHRVVNPERHNWAGPASTSYSLITVKNPKRAPAKVRQHSGIALLFLDCFERHVPGGTSGSLFPFREQGGVVFRDVIFVTRPKFLRRSIDPPRLALDFTKIPDRRFIHHYIAFAVTPLCSKLFIAEGWR